MCVRVLLNMKQKNGYLPNYQNYHMPLSAVIKNGRQSTYKLFYLSLYGLPHKYEPGRIFFWKKKSGELCQGMLKNDDHFCGERINTNVVVDDCCYCGCGNGLLMYVITNEGTRQRRSELKRRKKQDLRGRKSLEVGIEYSTKASVLKKEEENLSSGRAEERSRSYMKQTETGSRMFFLQR